jgi:hypothetical protein
MPWVRFDDQFPIHRKVTPLSDAAFRLATEAIFWSARNLTDGFIPEGDLAEVRPRLANPTQLAAELVKRRLWHQNSELCMSEECPAPCGEEPGWVIHDYWHFQPSKATVQRRRQEKQARQDRWLAKARRTRVTSRDASQDTTTDTPQTRLETQPRTRTVGAGTSSTRTYSASGGRSTPNGAPATGEKPPWCGTCDPQTRLTGEPPKRCPDCHPLRPVIDDPWATHE